MIQFQVTSESSVGVLWAAFHVQGALRGVEASLQQRVEQSSLFAAAGVSDVLLHVRVNSRDGKRLRPSGVHVNERWRFLTPDCYWAFVDADLSKWTAKSSDRSAEAALAGALPVLERLGWLALAQVAVELGVDPSRIAAFLADSPVDPQELSPRSKRMRRPKRRSLLAVQILCHSEHPNQQLAKYQRLAAILSKHASLSRLGELVGSSSSDEHFSFEFEVFDTERARTALTEALVDEGLDAGAINFAQEHD